MISNEEALLSLYDQLKSNLNIENKRIISNSILFTLIKMSSSERLRLLSSAYIDISDSPNKLDMLELINDGFLLQRVFNNEIYLIFTIRGLYYIEEKFYGIDHSQIISFLQTEYFNFGEQKLNPKEKSVLFTLITTHCFGSENSMDLTSNHKQNLWYEVMNDRVVPFLKEIKIISENETIINKTSGNETPITHLMRRLNNLSKKTSSIYSFNRNLSYYLNLDIQNLQKSKNLLFFLLESIFTEPVTYDVIKKTKDFINSTYAAQAHILHGKSHFDAEEWTSIIMDSLDRLILS